jgi:chitin disaccharide deacetylase
VLIVVNEAWTVSERVVIVNADDFGLTEGVNLGIVEAFEQGVVSSATLMVRPAAAGQAASYARRHPELAVGLHFDLGEWQFSDGGWSPRYEVVDMTDSDAVAAELARQLVLFEELVGRPPTHLDSHQHVHRDQPVAAIARRAARSLRIPLRHNDARIAFCGEFYGQTGRGQPFHQAITTTSFAGIIARLGEGWSELACHPGQAHDPHGDQLGTYGHERGIELAVLCDPRVRECLAEAQVRLASFADVPERAR